MTRTVDHTGSASCLVCGCRRVNRVFHKDGRDFWRCAECGFMRAVGPGNPNLESGLSGFDSAYLQYLAPDPADGRNFAAMWRWIVRWCPLEGRVLDVGAGSGKWVRYLRGRGVDAIGVEPASVLYERFLTGEPVFRHGGIETLPRRPTFDVITVFDVIEHIEHPSEFLAEVTSRLQPGGVVFVSTPDASSLVARLSGRGWHFYHRFHLSYFSSTNLARLAAQHGLALLEVGWQAKWRSVGYLAKYAVAPLRRTPPWLDRLILPFNTRDTMYLCFREASGRTIAEGEAPLARGAPA